MSHCGVVALNIVNGTVAIVSRMSPTIATIPPPWRSVSRPAIGAPMAAPGVYTVRLEVGGETFTQSFRLMMDPRQKTAGMKETDLLEQESLSLKTIELESAVKQLNEKVAAKRKLQNELNTEEGRYMVPMLLAQVNYLRGMLDQADQKPGKDAIQRYQELKSWYNRLVGLWGKVKGEDQDIKSLN